MQQAKAAKKEYHDANGKFFTRRETPDMVYWELCRYGSSVSDAQAVEDIKKNGYKRVETRGQNDHVYVKVSVLLATTAKDEVLKEINAHMGIQ